MAKTIPRYRRLPGKRIGPFRRETSWLGPDHILCVRSSRFSETYRRYYYRDIQAIVLRKSPGVYTMADWAVVILLAIVSLGAYSIQSYWTCGFFAIVGILVAVIRGLGANCTTMVQTAISLERLHAQSRFRPALQAVALIQERVLAAQQNLAADNPAGVGSVVPVAYTNEPRSRAASQARSVAIAGGSRALPLMGASALFLCGCFKFADTYHLFNPMVLPIAYLTGFLVIVIGFIRGTLNSIAPFGRIPVIAGLLWTGMAGVMDLGVYFQQTQMDPRGREALLAAWRILDVRPLNLTIAFAVLALGAVAFAAVIRAQSSAVENPANLVTGAGLEIL